ncbi:hypothetical protein BD779DRAFT_1465370 [Infundibulicybe gibba]|nr:hypothetical protein BD779DRAFT_1465370 [Infundibulicybe gibba]
MQFSIILIFASLALTGCAAPNAKRTAAQIEAGIAAISAQADALSSATAAFPSTGGPLSAVVAIHNDAVSLVSAINAGTNVVETTALPVAESDGQTILAALQALQSKILNVLVQFVDKVAPFETITIVGGTIAGRVTALVLQDLENLQKSIDSFLRISTVAEPADLETQVIAIQNNLDAAFTTAIGVYVQAQ